MKKEAAAVAAAFCVCIHESLKLSLMSVLW